MTNHSLALIIGIECEKACLSVSELFTTVRNIDIADRYLPICYEKR